MEGKFNIYVHSDCVEGGMQQLIFDKDELDDLALIKQSLQSELCFTDPTTNIVASVHYRTPEGQWLPLEAMSSGGGTTTEMANGGVHVSPPVSPSPLLSPFNPIHKASLSGDVSMTLKVTTEANVLAAKDAVIFEGITRLLLAELLGKNNIVAMGTVDRLIHDVRCHAAENLALSTTELIKSAPFARLQHGLSSQILKAIAKTAGDLGTVCTSVPAATIGAQIAGSIIPQIYRQAAAKSIPKRGLEGSHASPLSAAASGSALHAVRSSTSATREVVSSSGSQAQATPPSAQTPTAPATRNKAVRNKTSSASARYAEEYEENNDDRAQEEVRMDSAADIRVSAATSVGGNTARTEATGNYRSAAASLATAARRSDVNATPPPTPQYPHDGLQMPPSVLRQSSSYTKFADAGEPTRGKDLRANASTTQIQNKVVEEGSSSSTSRYYYDGGRDSAQTANGDGGKGFTAKDKITIYCVYSGATSQRAKAIQVSRANPAFDVVMQTLTYKFGSDVVLGFIDPSTGECSEVLSNEELKALINHCEDTDSLTLQCWARQSVKFDADVIDTEFERRMAAVDFGTGESKADYGRYEDEIEDTEERAAGGRNKAARPNSAAISGRSPASRMKSAAPASSQTSPSRYTNGYDINSNPLAAKPTAWEEYTRNSRYQHQPQINSNTSETYRQITDAARRHGSSYDESGASGISLIAAARNKSSPRAAGSAILQQASARGSSAVTSIAKPRLTSSALSQYDNNTSRAAPRGASPLSARSGGRNKSANPSSARRGGGAMSTISRGSAYGKPSFTPSHRLDVSGTAWNEGQLREIFDQFDKDNNGLLDREEMMDYFYTYHDDMGIVDAKSKFVQLLDEVPEFKDGKLTFDEFAVIMLKIAQW